MGAFGKAVGGGRRSAPRQKGSQAASLSTLSRIHHGRLVDLSPSGARISGSDLPESGQDAWLRIGTYKLFGSVRWVGETECGVEFLEPLSPLDVRRLLAEQGCR